MRSVCPLARSNCGTSSAIASATAVLISALISAAPAPPAVINSAKPIAAVSCACGILLSARL